MSRDDAFAATRRALLQRAAALAGASGAGALSLGPFGLPAALAAKAPAAAADDGPARPPVVTGSWEHAISAFVPPKYPKGFAHFDYVNPAAPKGGTLRLRNPDRRSSFDKFNPYTVKGVAPAGLLIFMFESLAAMSQDEPMAMYGLLAEEMLVAPDLSSISFRIRREARFSNGDPVTPQDVQHSFRELTGKRAMPSLQTGLAGLERVEVVDSRTVRFDLRERKTEQLFVAGTMPVFSRQWGQVDGRSKPFDEIVDEYPIASGPYLIDRVERPRRIEFRLNRDYWAKDLGVRRGWFNFERIVYRMYQDQAIAREAFKAGEFDLYKEYGARSWVRQHQGAKWRDGRIVKQAFETGTGQGLQSTNFNLRRPLFQDIRVREALTLAWDFETINRYKTFKRANSVFNNSEFAAEGEPSAGELRLLEPFRAELPPRVFGPAFEAPRTDADPNALRRNLLKARDLLEQAGWKVAPDGKLRNAQGQAFEFEYLDPSAANRNTDWQRNLDKLGITLKDRAVDFALYRRRLENYDFDTITIVEPDFTLPAAGDLSAIYGSKAADEKGNNNFRGVKSRAADALLAKIAQASTMEELRDAARAFDRVVMWNYWQMPELYNNTEQVSYWNRFGLPKVQPKYFSADTYFSGIVEFGPWPLWTWWDKALDGAPAAKNGRSA